MVFKKGYEMSEEHKKKISLARKGKNFREGTKHTSETRKKMSVAAKKRVDAGTHNFWKGGTTKLRDRIENTIEYRLWRESIFERDDYTCIWCKKRGRTLNADHIIPFSQIIEKLKFEQGVDELYEKAINYKLLWDINNGRTLCRDCHKKTDTWGRRI